MIYWLYKALALLPLPLKYGLAWFIAVLLQRVFRYRAQVIDTNLKTPSQTVTQYGEQT